MSTNDQFKVTFKVLLLGDTSVGKSCFLKRFTENTFQDVHISTIGLDYRLKEVKNKKGNSINVQIWDTAGQERFRSITKNYYRGAHGILILFDTTSNKSFGNMKNWVTQVKENSSSSVVVYIVGTKIDLEEARTVPQEYGINLGKELGLKYFETSAKTGINVTETFTELVEDIETKNANTLKKNEGKVLQENANRRRHCCG